MCTAVRCVKTFVAGLQHVTVAITSSAGRCSLGFNARNTAGTVYVLTAGHCRKPASTWSGFAGTIGTVAGSSFPSNDYGRIQRTNTAWVPTSKILGGSSILGRTVAAVGTTACRSGSTTGDKCGTVQALNQTACYSQGCVYQMTRTNACGEHGRLRRLVREHHAPGPGRVSGGSGNCSVGGTTFFQPASEILSVDGLPLVTG